MRGHAYYVSPDSWNGGQRDSYPYLHVARRRCVPYADVLCLVAFWDKRQYNGKFDSLTDLDRRHVFQAYCVEQFWRVKDAVTPAAKDVLKRIVLDAYRSAHGGEGDLDHAGEAGDLDALEDPRSGL